MNDKQENGESLPGASDAGDSDAQRMKLDAEWITRVLAGDTAQFQPLMEAHQQPIFAYLYRLLNGNVETAQDLTQTVFLKAFQNLAGFDRSRLFRPWLYRIAHNEAANHLRGLSRRHEVAVEPATLNALGVSAGENPEQAQSRADDRERVQNALQGLPEKYREVLLLYYFEDRGYEEMAEILNKNPRTVATLLRRARQKLQALLE